MGANGYQPMHLHHGSSQFVRTPLLVPPEGPLMHMFDIGGLPRINDGSLLFLQHMISKMNSAPSHGGDVSEIPSSSKGHRSSPAMPEAAKAIFAAGSLSRTCWTP